MQVFMPYSDYQKSVSCLDPKRLGNQIYRECVTLINGGWPNHPASKIWINHKHHLAIYSLFGLKELAKRGWYYSNWFNFFTDIYVNTEDTGPPQIIGYELYHASHRSQLLRKNFDWYDQFGWKESPGEFPYIWVIPETNI